MQKGFYCCLLLCSHYTNEASYVVPCSVDCARTSLCCISDFWRGWSLVAFLNYSWSDYQPTTLHVASGQFCCCFVLSRHHNWSSSLHNQCQLCAKTELQNSCYARVYLVPASLYMYMPIHGLCLLSIVSLWVNWLNKNDSHLLMHLYSRNLALSRECYLKLWLTHRVSAVAWMIRGPGFDSKWPRLYISCSWKEWSFV